MQNQITADQRIIDSAAVNAAIKELSTRNTDVPNNQAIRTPSIPVAIHIICTLTAIVIGFVAFALWILQPLEIFVELFVGPHFFLYANLVVIANMAAITGMWLMKKWGAYLYAAVFVIGTIYLIYYDCWFFNIGFVINLFATVIALFYSNRMK